MNQSSLVKSVVLLALLLVFVSGRVHAQEAVPASAHKRPNILWITAEDMSPTLGCYGDSFATTPSIDQLASESALYTHAFATSPVCSPSRACLINGCMAPTQGAHAMRSQIPIPTALSGFPTLLREVGYYTTNNVKTDYNSGAENRITEAAWDECSEEADWRGRGKGQPFFTVINLMESHQTRSMVWSYPQFQKEVQSHLSDSEIHDPNLVPLPPYYPDTPLVRKTVARYYDCVTRMDQRVGEILADLKADGLYDETIIFFYSDHGSGMPRHKRALLDSGMRVPLLIRLPEKYQAMARSVVGKGDVSRLVNFEDFGPTVLSLAGFDVLPAHMTGRAFLGGLDTSARQYVFGHRDRVDEIMDMARSIRSQDYLYIRNYMPHLGYNQQGAWIDKADIRGEFYKLAASGKASPAQDQYLSKTRPPEELYDCVKDPLNLNNLAYSLDHEATVMKMRKRLHQHLIETRDLGLVPELELWRHARSMPPMQWKSTEQFNPEAVLTAAELVGTDDYEAIAENLGDQDPAIRYWGAVACSAAEALPERLLEQLRQLFDDPSKAVAIEAANAVARHSGDVAAIETLTRWFDHDDRTVVLHAARAIELLADPRSKDAVLDLANEFQNEPGDLAWFIRFSTSGYLSRQD
ncbi:sulfatase-like hydrolase/transferase [Pseudomonadales bacterium]|nr:sulfatase-like hydrolase/transferase [Pseudomonadales bacterium]